MNNNLLNKLRQLRYLKHGMFVTDVSLGVSFSVRQLGYFLKKHVKRKMIIITTISFYVGTPKLFNRV